MVLKISSTISLCSVLERVATFGYCLFNRFSIGLLHFTDFSETMVSLKDKGWKTRRPTI